MPKITLELVSYLVALAWQGYRAVRDGKLSPEKEAALAAAVTKFVGDLQGVLYVEAS